MDSVDVTTFSEADGAGTRRIAVTADKPTDPLMAQASSQPASAASDMRCAECGAPMAQDQRYCVECGERRGEPRFPAVIDTSDAAAAQTGPAQRKRSRMSPSSTLIAGVGTLLLALGVGVLIGRSGTSSSGNAGSSVRVVTVGGSGSATTAPSSATGAAGTTSGTASKSSSTKAAATSTTVKTKAKLPPPTVKVGSKGTGKGYKNGHFTGEFFGSEE